jgi:hypothetical protein
MCALHYKRCARLKELGVDSSEFRARMLAKPQQHDGGPPDEIKDLMR